MNTKRMTKGLVITLLIIVTVLSICRTNVSAKAREFSKETDTYETDFRCEVKEVLKTVGAKNAGVTMTKRCEDGHYFNYEVVINLPEYIELSNEEKENLLVTLKALDMEVTDSTVEFSFS